MRVEKNELEDTIRQARKDRLNAEKELAEVQREWDQEQTHLQEVRTQIRDLEDRLEQLRTMAEDLTRFTSDLQSTLKHDSGRLNAMSRKLKDIIGEKDLLRRFGLNRG